MAGDEKRYTEQDVINANRTAVLESKMDDIENFVPEIFATLKALTQSVTKIPADVSMEIITCRDKMDEDVKRYIHDNFVDRVEMSEMETRIERKISRASWTISAFILAYGFYDFLSNHTNFFG